MVKTKFNLFIILFTGLISISSLIADEDKFEDSLEKYIDEYLDYKMQDYSFILDDLILENNYLTKYQLTKYASSLSLKKYKKFIQATYLIDDDILNIEIRIFNTTEEAKTDWIEHILVSPDSEVLEQIYMDRIGDIEFRGEDTSYFLRANVIVNIHGKKEIVMPLSQEIDKQIVGLIANAGERKIDRPSYLKSVKGGKSNAEIWVSQIREYTNMADDIVLRNKYEPNYLFSQLKPCNEFEEYPFILNEIIAEYKQEGNNVTTIKLIITRYKSVFDAQNTWLRSLDGTTNPFMLRIQDIGINVGDIGWGHAESLLFIRANIMVSIESSNDDLSIVEMAKEIDRQILDTIKLKH